MTHFSRMGLALVLLFSIASTAKAQTADHTSGSHGHHDGVSASTLSEPGQGAFAALAEVVHALESDAQTDWSNVDITALRDHLIDMDLLVTDAIATQTELEDGLSIEVTGDAQSLAAAQRMIPAHSEFLRREEGWEVAVTIESERVIMRLTGDTAEIAMKIKALGFYGLMASQDHHRMHHWALARGEPMHLNQ